MSIFAFALVAFFILCPKVSLANYLGIALLGAMLLCTIAQFKGSLLSTTIKPKYYFLVFLVVAIMVAGCVSGSLSSGAANAANTLLRLSPVIVFDLLVSTAQGDNMKRIRQFERFSIACVAYCVFVTAFLLIDNPYFAREMANYTSLDSYGGAQFVATGGGYSLLFGLVPIFALLGFFLSGAKLSSKNRIMILLLAVGFFLFFLKANVATPLVLAVLGFVVAMLLGGSEAISARRMLFIFSLCLLVYILLASGVLVGAIDNLLGLLPADSIISMRLSAALGISDVGDTSGDRLGRMALTVGYIQQNPLFGAVPAVGSNYNDLVQYLGMHTEWLDFCGMYGVVLFAFYVLFMICAFSDLLSFGRKLGYYPLCIVMAVICFAAGLFDPIRSTSMYSIVFAVIPSIMLCHPLSECRHNLRGRSEK